MMEYDDPEVQKQQERAEIMRQRYRNVFGTEEGRKVLGDILVLCHFGVPLNNEAERIEYNVGIAIARLSGIMQAVDRHLGIEEE